MKHLVMTNLPDTLGNDYRNIFTEEVKNGYLAYMNGEDGSSPEVEQNYVLEKFLAARAELPDEITVVPKYDINEYLKNGYKCIHVDGKTGANSNSGTADAPYATIERALEKARPGVPTAIVIHAGSYAISDTLQITQKLTGTPDAPFIFTSAGDGEVLISAAKSLESSAKCLWTADSMPRWLAIC